LQIHSETPCAYAEDHHHSAKINYILRKQRTQLQVTW